MQLTDNSKKMATAERTLKRLRAEDLQVPYAVYQCPESE